MADVLAVVPEFRVTAEVRRASSDCHGAKLDVAGDDVTQRWVCQECGQPCDRVLSDPVEVTAGG